MVIRHDTELDKWNVVVDAYSDDHYAVKFFTLDSKRVIRYNMKRKRWEFDNIEAAKAFVAENRDQVIIDPTLEAKLN